ncbi:MAG: phenylacetic acid degradation b [Hymenobacteraceae bacterium]|nr:phenylacetic acid degradation b [Hymenobacteraceae bacterium]
MLLSLDPRVTRLHLPDDAAADYPKGALDQLETYEVFHQRKEGQPFTYVGPVHAASLDVAFLFGKEQYSRRFPCVGMWVCATRDVLLTAYTDEAESVYATLDLPAPTGTGEAYEIFHLKKRGKGHVHAGTVTAATPPDALAAAKAQLGEVLPCVNVWVVRAADLLRSREEDKDIWDTVTDKKYRDAIAWKVQDRIERFKAERATQ